jgi:hypothetical protein
MKREPDLQFKAENCVSRSMGCFANFTSICSALSKKVFCVNDFNAILMVASLEKSPIFWEGHAAD